MYKIAICCDKEEQWDKIKTKMLENSIIFREESQKWHVNKEKTGICEVGCMGTPGWGSVGFFEGEGYAIISAKEYLSVKNKIIKPKTKENKMNETIRKVFKGDTLELAEKMDDNFGNDTLLEGFSGEVILTEHKQKYIEEIVRREEEAKKEEAK